MEYILTKSIAHSQRGVDGKSRNFILYMLNGVIIIKQKHPFDTDYGKGWEDVTHIYDEYLIDGRLYQTRHHKLSAHYSPNRENKTERKERFVYFPISKSILKQFEIPKGLKIKINERTNN